VVQGVPEDRIWNIFYHFLIDKPSHELLVEHSQRLADAARSLKSWGKSQFGSYMTILTSHTLTELRRHWTQYMNFHTLSPKRVAKLRREYTELSKSTADKFEFNLSASRSAGPLWIEACHPVAEQFKEFWKTGTTFTSTRDIQAATELNPTFIYSLSGEKFNPHYGTYPATTFHLFSAFAPTVNDSRRTDARKTANATEASKSQFKTWCLAFRMRVLSKKQTLQLRFYAGDALAFCRAVNIKRKGGIDQPGIQVRPWQNKPIHFDNYEKNDVSSPTIFDVIDTSNLMDHLGLLNILLATQPLLKRNLENQAVIYTEALLAFGQEPATALKDRLCMEVPSFALLFGLAPRPYLSEFVTQSHSHEILFNSVGSTERQGQYHERIPWVRPGMGDRQNSSSATLEPIVFDPADLAGLFFAIYGKMMANEHIFAQLAQPSLSGLQQMSKNHYNRATFVNLMRAAKDEIAVKDNNWTLVAKVALGFIEQDRSSLVGMNYYQELCAQLNLQGIFTVDSMGSDWKSNTQSALPGVVPTMKVFGSWEDVPPIVCVVFIVPREKMSVFDNEEDGSPGLQAHLYSSFGHDNTFDALSAGPGSSVILEQPGVGRIVDGDSEITSGSRDFIFSFYAPSWLLRLPETRVALCLKTSPFTATRYSQTLGFQLTIYETPVTNTNRVFIVRERPGLTGEVNGIRALANHQEVHSGNTTPLQQTSVQMSGPKVVSLTARIDFSKIGDGTILANGTQVSASQSESCAMELRTGSMTQDVIFPYPVNGTSNKLRIARKSAYIEVSFLYSFSALTQAD
jgi:hypothetical protein